MTQPEVVRPKRQWIGLLVTTLLGIGATIVVGWYQLTQAERQVILAEKERARGVRETLVSIIEDHVLNDKPIDVPRLARLIDQRRRQERVLTPISVVELLEQAEFNILNSRYLPFERKQALNAVFDTLYADLSTREFAPFSPDAPNADLFNALARQVQDGKTGDALQTIKRLQEAQVKDLQQARSGRSAQNLSQMLRELASDPRPIVELLGVFAFSIFFANFLPRIIRILQRLPGLPISKSDAEERVADYIAMGLPEEIIVDRLKSLGAPADWVSRQIAKARAEANLAETVRPDKDVEAEG